MRLFTKRVTRTDLDEIAAEMECEIYEYDDEGGRQRGKYAGKRCHRFMLRPLGNSDKFRKTSSNMYMGNRRVFAVSWAGHYVFMWAVFTLDNNATFKTALDEWAGLEDFSRRAMHSGMQNVGSQMAPMQYRECQTDDHYLWFDETDLRTAGVRLVKDKLNPADLDFARTNMTVLS